MIQYALKCADGHTFDSWFQSASAYDKLAASGMVTCVICGGGGVDKAVMTPRVQSSARQTQTAEAGAGPLSQPANPAEQALAALKRQIEENSDYVGKNFATEARAIHEGAAPERSIYGEARIDEAKALVQEGIPVAPLPFTPGRKAN